jgi:glycosyltransferase involved in cell wall biosynthesis
MISGQLATASSDCVESLPLMAERVVYFSPSFAPYTVPVFDLLYRLFGKGFTVVALRRQRLEIGRVALRMGAFPRRTLSGLSLRLWPFRDTGRATPLPSLQWSPALPFVLTSLSPEVVISNNFSPWTLTSTLMGYPTVLFWEGTHHTERTVGRLRTRLRRWIAKQVVAFVVNGTLSRRYLIDTIGVPPERIIEGGICAEPPPADVRPAPKTLRPGDPLRCLFVGQMVGRKGVPHLLHAARILESRLGRQAQFEIDLVGDGPELPRYQSLAGELGIQNRVHFGGFFAPGRIWHCYEQAHVFVLPTLQDNWPLVVPEAMSMGLPVLVSKHTGSVPDLIREGENGYSFDPEDHERLAYHLEQYVKNPDLIRKHGQRSIELVSPFNPQRAANAFLWAIAKAKQQATNS